MGKPRGRTELLGKRHRRQNCEGSSERVGKGASFKWAGAHESISIELRWSFSAFRNFEVGRWALSVCFSAALPSFFFLEMRRVSGAEFTELLIKHGLGRDNWRFDVKNRCASDETDSLVSSRAEESSQTLGVGKRSGTNHRADRIPLCRDNREAGFSCGDISMRFLRLRCCYAS